MLCRSGSCAPCHLPPIYQVNPVAQQMADAVLLGFRTMQGHAEPALGSSTLNIDRKAGNLPTQGIQSRCSGTEKQPCCATGSTAYQCPTGYRMQFHCLPTVEQQRHQTLKDPCTPGQHHHCSPARLLMLTMKPPTYMCVRHRATTPHSNMQQKRSAQLSTAQHSSASTAQLAQLS